MLYQQQIQWIYTAPSLLPFSLANIRYILVPIYHWGYIHKYVIIYITIVWNALYAIFDPRTLTFVITYGLAPEVYWYQYIFHRGLFWIHLLETKEAQSAPHIMHNNWSFLTWMDMIRNCHWPQMGHLRASLYITPTVIITYCTYSCCLCCPPPYHHTYTLGSIILPWLHLTGRLSQLTHKYV